MNRLDRSNRSKRGAALILILGIVALLSVMVIAFLGTSSKQVVATAQSHSIIQEQQLAELATTQFLADINNEIRAGSVTPTSAGTIAVYYPATPLSAVPDRSTAGTSTSSSVVPSAPVIVAPNLLKRTAFGKPIYDKNLGLDKPSDLDNQPAFPHADIFPGTLRASNVSSGSGALSGGSVSAARWNKPLLLPRADPSKGNVFPDGYEPLTSGTLLSWVAGQSKADKWTWAPPDWVFITKSGATPTTWDSSLNSGSSATAVVGRYAYQAYDVGGLLDLNVAGYSSDIIGGSLVSTKGSAGLADLSVLGFTDTQLKALLAFRNPATPANSGSVSDSKTNKYFNFLLRTPDPNASSSALWPANNAFMRVGSLNNVGNRAFYSRQSLQAFLLGGMGAGTPSTAVQAKLMDSLQSLTHFSRALEQPSYKPGFYLADSSGKRTRSNAIAAGVVSDKDSPLFIRPSIVPPMDKVDDSLYPPNVTPSAVVQPGYAAWFPMWNSVNPPADKFNATSFGGQSNPLSAVTAFVQTYVGTGGSASPTQQPYEMALGNNRGGNDAWGTLAERSDYKPTVPYPTNPLRMINSTINPSQKKAQAAKTAIQDVINPSFLEVRVRKTFKRIDGTDAVIGEPLVKKRFPLERLAWITSKGPSKDNGGDTNGTAENIYKAFGLVWTASKNPAEPGNFWAYNHHGALGEKYTEDKVGEIYTLDELVDDNKQGQTDTNLPREPDFFELLYAAINVGSVGKSAVASHAPGVPYDPATYYQVRDRTSRFQIMEIGANIIDQYDSDSFPTIIKMPVYGSSSPYYPALFTARGIEDLPYFNRLQWRAIKNVGSGPLSVSAEADIDAKYNSTFGYTKPGIIQIPTGQIGSPPWDNSYQCGTTSLIAFPELWNPHAQSSGSGDGPTEFRVIARSETPTDILHDPNRSISYGVDIGLKNNPKMIMLSGLPTAAQTFWRTATSITGFHTPLRFFSIRPTADFYFLQGATNTAQVRNFTSSKDFLTESEFLGGQFQTYHYTFIPNYHDLLFFNGFVLSGGTVSSLLNTSYTYSQWVYPLETLPAKDSGAAHSVLTPYIFSGTANVVLAGGTFTQFGVISTSTLLSTLKSSYWYNLADATSGGNFNQNKTRQISLIPGTDPGAAFPRKLDKYLPTGTDWVDFRGTELTFSLTNNSTYFRESVPLCTPSQPWNGNLQTGENNFFKSAPYDGAVQDTQGGQWTGFSLGEVPSQFLSAVRFEASVLSSTGSGSTIPVQKLDGTYTTVPGGVSSLGIQTRISSSEPLYVPTGPEATPVSADSSGKPTYYDKTPLGPGLGNYDLFAYFAVPVNMVGIDHDHYMTIQVQCKVNGNWITYDERYVKIPTDDNSLGNMKNLTQLRLISSTPVLFKEQVQAKYNSGVFKDWVPPTTGPTVKWGFPMLSSYDPRSPRFGHPVRTALNSINPVSGATAASRMPLQPTNTLDGGLTPLGGVANNSSRTGNLPIDSLTTAGTPSVLTLNDQVPADWNSIMFRYTKDYTFENNYLAIQNSPYIWNFPISVTPGVLFTSGAPISAQWWGQAKDPVSNQSLWRFPSINSYDYGWFPRTYDGAGVVSPTTSLVKSGSVASSFTTDTYLPNFRRDPVVGSSILWTAADALRIGCFSENVQPKAQSGTDPLATDINSPYRQAYADPDDVVRRAMGAFAAYNNYDGTTSKSGLPLAITTTTGGNPDNRPVVINRPFRSVADMAAAFRGAPWKNISFSTPETGDAALLDVFCVTEPPPLMPRAGAPVATGSVAAQAPLVAGKVNLNTRQEKVLEALISGALKDEVNGGTMANTGTTSEVVKAAQSLIGRTIGSKVWLGPLSNVSEIAGKLFGKDLAGGDFSLLKDPVYTSTAYKTGTKPPTTPSAIPPGGSLERNPDLNPSSSNTQLNWHFTGFSADLDSNNVFTATKDRKNLRMREAVVRALVDSGQTRVWNIMLDLIVQTGRLPSAATDLKQFVKEGEHRVWVFLAIDRLTGEVLDKIVEDVAE
jgi:hypothetical protein